MFSILKSVAPFNTVKNYVPTIPPIINNTIFQKFLQNSVNGFVLIDVNLNIVYKNTKAETIIGREPSEQVPEGINILVHHDDRRRVASVLVEIASGAGLARRCSFRTRPVHGHFLWLDCNITNHISDPEIKAFVFDFQIVSEEQTKQQRLRLDEKKFKVLIENGTDAVVVIDKNRNPVYISPAFEKILGYSEQEAYLLNGIDIIHPDDLAYTVSKLQESFKNPLTPIKNILYRAKHKDGRYLMLNAALTNLMDDPTIGGIVNNFRDVTEQKKSEADLIESEDKYRTLFDNSPIPLFFWDSATSNIKECNEAALFKYGYTRDEFLKLTILDLWPPDDIVVPVDDIIKSIHLNNVFKILRRHKKKNGDVIYVDINGRLINYKGADMILTMCDDVTETQYYAELDKLEKTILETASKKNAFLNAILTEYVAGMEALHHGMLCSIFENRGDRLFNMTPCALPPNYIREIDGLKIANLKGPCGTAATTRKTVVCPNISKSNFSAKYKRIAKDNGLQSCWSHPLIDSNDKVMAVFACYYRFEKHPNELEQKTIERAVNILQVVMESKSWQAALLLSNDRFEHAMDATYDVIWDWDLVTNSIYYSANLTKFFGHTAGIKNDGLTFYRANVHPDDLDKVLLYAEQVKLGKLTEWAGEYRFKKFDGQYAFVKDRAVVILDGKGNAIRMIGAIKDISTKKSEEEHLKMLESVITNTSDAIKITEAASVDGLPPRVLYVNNAFTKMTGYTLKDILGKPAQILLGPRSDKEEIKRCLEALARFEPYDGTIINYKKNGDFYWKHISLTPVLNDMGTCTHWVAIEHDVTAMKNEELQRNLLVEIGFIFNSSATLNESLQRVLKRLVDYGNFSLTEFWLVDENKETVSRVATYSNHALMQRFVEETNNGISLKKGRGLVGLAWELKKVQYWNYVDENPGFIRLQKAKEAGIKRAYSIPLIYNDEVIGALGLFLADDEFPLLGFPDMFENFSKAIGAEIKRKLVEQELNQIFEFTPDILCVAHIDGYFKKVNPAMSQLLGYGKNELLSKPFMDFIHPLDRDGASTELHNIIQGKPTYYIENRYITKYGKIKWLAWTTTGVSDQGTIYCAAKDITDKKELEELLNKATRLARIGAWDVDLKNGIVNWSAITREIHETAPDFVPDINIASAFYREGDDRQRIMEIMNTATTLGMPADIEIQITTAKGNSKWVRVIVETEFLDGKCNKLYGSFQDIDSRKKAELAARQALEERNSILESIDDPFYAVDNNWNVTYWNSRAEKQFNKTKAEIATGTLLEVFPGWDGSEPYYKYEEVLKSGQPARFEHEGIHSKAWYESSVFPTNNGIAVHIKDITVRKTSELRLTELNDALQKHLKKLAISNDELEQFAYVASHDMQEPLRMVTSFMTQFEKKYGHTIDNTGKKYIHFAVDGAMRMRQIILDLLDFSRVGRVDSTTEDVDFNLLIGEILEIYEQQTIDLNAKFIIENLPAIKTYKTPLLQVFQNLIGNSLKYHNLTEAPLITISCRETKNHYQFSVKDNGIGIASAYFDKIFVIFQRLHNKDDYSGTGIGLAITKKIIENLGGEIWVKSQEGKGSKFYFTLLKT